MSKIEKIIKLEDGSKLKVLASVQLRYDKITYRLDVYRCLPGKRSYSYIIDRESFSYRGLSMEQREGFRLKSCIEAIGEAQVQAIFDELWQSIKPDLTRNATA